ncbi:hypothetical protein [Mesorhizobium sp. B2-3-4]|uniref:hypothetical protein n=1 Tax=Mesorhizobium sp. B2-3-4 TaxID=2589959 RepID=UPI00112A49FE|nr:hypothetical protein [Mesorhizobium sp. B2-3-4]TPM25699.1 hypothetical protein FJ967_32250 [Mesorhizobium sp. B2-3-4]
MDAEHLRVGRGSAAAQQVTRQVPLANLYEALKNLNEAAATTRNMADQLCGSQPEAVGKEAAPQSASVFGQIDDVAEAVNAHASRIMGDMQRIQSRL